MDRVQHLHTDDGSVDRAQPHTLLNLSSQAVAISAMCPEAHHDLIPYVRSELAVSKSLGVPVIRAMFLEFPNDPNPAVADMADQYMYGPNLLVAVRYPGRRDEPFGLSALRHSLGQFQRQASGLQRGSNDCRRGAARHGAGVRPRGSDHPAWRYFEV